MDNFNIVKKLLLINVIICLALLYFFYRNKPLFPVPYESACPYYKDLFGRFFIRIKTGSLFVITKEVIVWNHKKTINADEFTLLSKENSCYGTDGKTVFFSIWKIDGADARSWEYLGGNYSKDINNVYYDNKTLAGMNSSQFTFIVPTTCKSNDLYAKKYVMDLESVWYKDKQIPEADAASFTVFCKPGDGNLYGKDKSNIYSEGKILPD